MRPQFRAWPGAVEIPADDLARALKFYQRALGWPGRRASWEQGTYAGLATGAEVGIGLVSRSGTFPRPVAMVHVVGASLEEALARIEAAGGRTVQPPRAVERGGRFATFEDSEGNLMGLWEEAEGRRSQPIASGVERSSSSV